MRGGGGGVVGGWRSGEGVVKRNVTGWEEEGGKQSGAAQVLSVA